MALGIRLEIDKGSIKNAASQLRGGIDRGSKGFKKNLGSGSLGSIFGKDEKEGNTSSGKDGQKKSGAFGGALTGGFIGAIIGSLKPVQELLGVISGIMTIFMVPILILLKPFLILFLKVGMLLYKAFSSDPGQTAGEQKKNKVGTVLGVIGAVILAIVAAIAGAPAAIIAAVALAAFFLFKYLFEFGFWLGQKFAQFFTWLMDSVLLPVWKWLGDKIKAIGEAAAVAWEWIKTAGATIWDWLAKGFKIVLGFGSKIWNLFLNGLSFISGLGKLIWDYLKEALSSIGDLGSKIWSYIKSAMRSLVNSKSSSSETSVDDALITSQGQIVHLNQNDNLLAFQDYSQIENMAGATGGSSGGNVSIVVNGFVGDDQELAEKISTALNKYGGVSY